MKVDGLPGTVGDTSFMLVSGDPEWWVGIDNAQVDRDVPKLIADGTVRVRTIGFDVGQRADAQSLLAGLKQFIHQYCSH